MKKIILLFISIIFLSFLCGCSIQKENNINIKNQVTKNCSITREFQSKMKCPEMKDIKHNGYGIFITNNGELYEFSSKKYSTTNTNCKKIDTDIKFDRIVKGTLIATTGECYTYYNGELKQPTKEQIEMGRAWYGLDQMEIKLYNIKPNIFYLADIDHEKPNVYGYIDNNNVYSIAYDWNRNQADEKLIYTFPDDEEIEHITNGYIITNKAYYVYGITNKKQCSAYTDIECEYGLIREEEKNNCIDTILYISDSLIVTKEMIS